MDDFDLHRAAWFRENLTFVSHGLIDRRTLWASWSTWCERHGVEPRSKTSMWKWLIAIGARQRSECGHCTFGRLKFIGVNP